MRKEKDPIYNSNNKDKTSRNKFFKFQRILHTDTKDISCSWLLRLNVIVMSPG